MLVYRHLPGCYPSANAYCLFTNGQSIGYSESKNAVLSQTQGAYNSRHESSFSKLQVRVESFIRYTANKTVGLFFPNEGVKPGLLLDTGVAKNGEKYHALLWNPFMPISQDCTKLRSQYHCEHGGSLSYWSIQEKVIDKYHNVENRWTWNELYFQDKPNISTPVIVWGALPVGATDVDIPIDEAVIIAQSRVQRYGSVWYNTMISEIVNTDITRSGGIPPQWFNERFVRQTIALARSNSVPSRLQNQCKGEALLSCVEGAQVSDVFNFENVIELVSLIKQPTSVVSDAAKLIKPITSKKAALKRLADMKLSYDYSVKTTISDVKTLSHDLRKYIRSNNSESISRGRSNFVVDGQYGMFHYTYRCEEAYKVFYGSVDESLLPLYRSLQNIGLDPSFEHVWNVIPYSFVVDWLYPVQKIFAQVDYDTNVATLPIHAVTHGKWERHHFENDVLKVDISTYNRDLANNLPDFPYFLPEFSPNMNWWNAGALIVQRVR